MKNYYDLLCIKTSSTQEEIKTAYHNMIKAFHPDYYKGNQAFAEEMSKEINKAYGILKNPNTRRDYDEWLLTNQPSQLLASKEEVRKAQKKQAEEQAKKVSTNSRAQTIILNIVALVIGMVSLVLITVILQFLINLLYGVPLLGILLTWPNDQYWIGMITLQSAPMILSLRIIHKVEKKSWPHITFVLAFWGLTLIELIAEILTNTFSFHTTFWNIFSGIVAIVYGMYN